MERPISPHLQIYKFQVTMVMSILHRMSGIANIAGLLMVSSLFIGAAYGPDSYAAVASLVLSWPGLVLLAGFTVSICYHLCNGIRHLVWDTGRALDMESVRRGAFVALAVAALLFVAIWV